MILFSKCQKENWNSVEIIHAKCRLSPPKFGTKSECESS